MNFFRHNFKQILLASASCVFAYKLLNLLLTRSKRKNKVLVIESVSDWNANENEILTTFHNEKFIGIDCEWVTIENQRKPIALLQLATAGGFCVLVRLFLIPVWLIPQELSELLQDRDLLKVGVGIFDDAKKLINDYCLSVNGLIDLRHFAKDLPELQGCISLGLKSLTSEILGENLTKSNYLRCSNWEATSLSEDQIRYAADDAIVSAKIISEVRNKLTWNFYSSGNESYFDKSLDFYTDIPFKQSSVVKTGQVNTGNLKSLSFKTRYSKPRQKPMYSNCRLEAPDGELLCSCDKRKAEWYAYKGLGEIINDHPFTVRLNFEPSGRPTLDDFYYTKTKLNCCVVCGAEQNFHRKLIVPSEYRKYFPELMKKYLSHDVLLLCVDCHKRSNILDQNLRHKIAIECDAPISCGKTNKYIIDPVLSRLRSAAFALLSSDKLPDPRRQTLENIIKEHYEIGEINQEVLKNAANVVVAIPNQDFICHGLKVYQHACAHGGLINFEKRWRQHFLDTMKPKFLPVMWSIEHNHERLALHVMNKKVNFDVSILGLDEALLERVKNYEFHSTRSFDEIDLHSKESFVENDDLQSKQSFDEDDDLQSKQLFDEYNDLYLKQSFNENDTAVFDNDVTNSN